MYRGLVIDAKILALARSPELILILTNNVN